MRRSRTLAFLLPAAALAASVSGAQAPAPSGRVHHSMKVTLDPARGWLSVEDVMKVPADPSGHIEFLLHGGLRITASEPAVEEGHLGDTARFLGINASTTDVPLKRYHVALPAAGAAVRLRYEGKFDFGLSDQKEEYTRGFRETAGIVSRDGLYLAGNGFWYPHVGPGLVEYDLEVSQPEGWHVIGAGNGTSRDAKGAARWESHGPVDEITLVGGPLLVYRDSAGAVETLVYLRQKDDALASKYLQATAQ